MSDGFEEMRMAIKFCESRGLKENTKQYRLCIDAFASAAWLYGKEMKALLKEAIEELRYLENERLQASATAEMSGRVSRILLKAEKYLNNGECTNHE